MNLLVMGRRMTVGAILCKKGKVRREGKRKQRGFGGGW